jgi:hypothetical protein
MINIRGVEKPENPEKISPVEAQIIPIIAVI